MLSLNTPCHVGVPNAENKRVLVAGKVIELDGARCVARFEEPLELTPDSELVLFAEFRGKFHQQGAMVLAIRETGETPTIEFTRVGEPVNCESRGCYRVSVVSQEIPVTAGKLGVCQLADVSAEGISIITDKPMMIGSSVTIDLTEGNVRAMGSLRVQSEKRLSSGKLRYGLFATEKRSPLRKSLETLSGMMQRQQLRRRAGAA